MHHRARRLAARHRQFAAIASQHEITRSIQTQQWSSLYGKTTKQTHRNELFVAGLGTICFGCLSYASYSTGRWWKIPYLRADAGRAIASDPGASTKFRGDTKVLSRGEAETRALELKESQLEKAERRQTSTPSEASKPNIATEESEETAWLGFRKKITGAMSSVQNIQWASIPDAVTAYILPTWALMMPEYISKLQRELSTDDGSLAREIWDEAQDMELNPEIIREAVVRVSNDLAPEEKEFLEKRKVVTRKAFAKYIGVSESDVHIDDVPTIALCGSGGGLRAMIAGAGSLLSAAEDGLFQCATYTAGVSGSCWAQAIFNSHLTGQDMSRAISHLKARVGTHIAYPPKALELLNMAPTNKYLLKGVVEKLRSDPKADWGLVDIYGLLLAGRLLVPKGELDIHDEDLRVSAQRQYLESGQNPLPIYTAVRHEIPLEEVAEQEEHKSPSPMLREETKEKARREAWFQWFEWTPYELFCEEIGAGIPAWAVGRRFKNGRDVPSENGLRAPELKMPTLLGLWGSAFCATLSHYYKEVRPILQGLTGFASLDKMVEDRNDDLIKVHPIDPAAIPNFALGMEEALPASTPRSIFSQDSIQLMDAGMSNNLPLYPLLRPGRNCDVIIAFDSSADIQIANWLSLTDGYAKQRGIKGWPIGAGWPKPGSSSQQNARDLAEASAKSADDASARVEAAKKEDTDRQEAENGNSKDVDDALERAKISKDALGYCAVWVGSKEERTDSSEPPPSKIDFDDDTSHDWKLMDPHAGIAVVYFPLIPNDAVPGVDPDTTDYLSTWNFIYTPEQVDKVVELARQNYGQGRGRVKRVLRAVWERKRALRLEEEARGVETLQLSL
jgi:phospholipase A2